MYLSAKDVVDFRSSERRTVLCDVQVYKHLAPDGVKSSGTLELFKQTA